MKNLKQYEDFVLESKQEEEINESILPDLSGMDLGMQIFWWFAFILDGIAITGFIGALGKLGYEMLKFALGEVKEKITETEKGKKFFELVDSIFATKDKDEAKSKIQQLGEEYSDVIKDISKMGKTEAKVAEGIQKAIDKANK